MNSQMSVATTSDASEMLAPMSSSSPSSSMAIIEASRNLSANGQVVAKAHQPVVWAKAAFSVRHVGRAQSAGASLSLVNSSEIDEQNVGSHYRRRPRGSQTTSLCSMVSQFQRQSAVKDHEWLQQWLDDRWHRLDDPVANSQVKDCRTFCEQLDTAIQKEREIMARFPKCNVKISDVSRGGVMIQCLMEWSNSQMEEPRLRTLLRTSPMTIVHMFCYCQNAMMQDRIRIWSEGKIIKEICIVGGARELASGSRCRELIPIVNAGNIPVWNELRGGVGCWGCCVADPETGTPQSLDCSFQGPYNAIKHKFSGKTAMMPAHLQGVVRSPTWTFEEGWSDQTTTLSYCYTKLNCWSLLMSQCSDAADPVFLTLDKRHPWIMAKMMESAHRHEEFIENWVARPLRGRRNNTLNVPAPVVEEDSDADSSDAETLQLGQPSPRVSPRPACSKAVVSSPRPAHSKAAARRRMQQMCLSPHAPAVPSFHDDPSNSRNDGGRRRSRSPFRTMTDQTRDLLIRSGIGIMEPKEIAKVVTAAPSDDDCGAAAAAAGSSAQAKAAPVVGCGSSALVRPLHLSMPPPPCTPAKRPRLEASTVFTPKSDAPTPLSVAPTVYFATPPQVPSENRVDAEVVDQEEEPCQSPLCLTDEENETMPADLGTGEPEVLDVHPGNDNDAAVVFESDRDINDSIEVLFGPDEVQQHGDSDEEEEHAQISPPPLDPPNLGDNDGLSCTPESVTLFSQDSSDSSDESSLSDTEEFVPPPEATTTISSQTSFSSPLVETPPNAATSMLSPAITPEPVQGPPCCPVSHKHAIVPTINGVEVKFGGLDMDGLLMAAEMNAV